MRSKLYAIIVAAGAVGFLFGYVSAQAEDAHKNHGTMDHGATQQAPGKTATGVGVVHAINKETRMVNLTHEPMPDLGWPVMTMDLQATNRVDFGALKDGDKVTFTLKLGRDNQYRIIEIAPAP